MAESSWIGPAVIAALITGVVSLITALVAAWMTSSVAKQRAAVDLDLARRRADIDERLRRLEGEITAQRLRLEGVLGRPLRNRLVPLAAFSSTIIAGLDRHARKASIWGEYWFKAVPVEPASPSEAGSWRGACLPGWR